MIDCLLMFDTSMLLNIDPIFSWFKMVHNSYNKLSFFVEIVLNIFYWRWDIYAWQKQEN